MPARKIWGLGGILILASAQTAQAKPVEVRVTTSVPESCRFDAPTITLEQGEESAMGFAWEACNSRRGYRITTTTRRLDSAESVMVSYDNRATQLNSSGQTTLLNRAGPILKRIPVSVRATDLSQPLTLSVSMTVI